MIEHILHILPSGESKVFPSGTLLADAFLDMGVVADFPCGGKGTCGKCATRIAHFNRGKNDSDTSVRESSMCVLACQYRITQNIEVRIKPERKERRMLPRLKNNHSYGLAVDIGTTTICMSLVDKTNGSSYRMDSFLNPQRRFGHDVISRIEACRNPENSMLMRKIISGNINIRLKDILSHLGLSGDRIESVVFSGNTIMLYLLLGIDVVSLGCHPYRARIMDFSPILAGQIGLDIIGKACALALPVAGAFTGGDLIGALTLCHCLGWQRNVYFIDLGTNGELFVLDSSGRPFITSCAMGPALEGMNISSGMAAYDGAIIHINEDDGGLTYTMVGDGEPLGITGTALIDLISLLLDYGLISKNGSFTRDIRSDSRLRPLYFDQETNSPALKLWGQIRLTQKDIRQVQYAKAASYSASLFLLRTAGIEPGDIDDVIIAGSFGKHANIEHLRKLSFIPDFPVEKVTLIGNTSLQSAEKACMDRDFVGYAKSLRDKCQDVPLSIQPDFKEVFIRALAFNA